MVVQGVDGHTGLTLSEAMDTDPNDASDLEYDLAHETQPPSGASSPEDDEAPDTVRVTTETPSYHGDYSYDLAHEVPGR